MTRKAYLVLATLLLAVTSTACRPTCDGGDPFVRPPKTLQAA